MLQFFKEIFTSESDIIGWAIGYIFKWLLLICLSCIVVGSTVKLFEIYWG